MNNQVDGQVDGRAGVPGIVTRVADRIGVDPIVLGMVAFFVAHMLIRLFGTSNFSVDDTETAVHTQVFQLYYSLRNPPLFNWLYFGLSEVFGSNLITMQILKTALLIAAGWFFYSAIRPAFRHREALYAAIVSYGATAYYGWDVFQQFSHTITLIFSMGFTLWAFMRLLRRAHTVDFVVLGVGLGLGIMSKYLFGLYFVALVIAALRSPSYRAALLSWRLLLTIIVALIVVSPLLIGLYDVMTSVFATVGGRVAGSGNGFDIASLGSLVLLTAMFWLPFLAILAVGLYRWPASEAGNAQSPPDALLGEGDDDFYRLVRDATLIMFAAVLAAVLFLGTRISGVRYLIAVLSLLPVAVFVAIDRKLPFPALALRNFQRGAVAFIVGIAVIRFLIFLFISPPFCIPRCVLFVDYTPVVERLGTADGKQNVILSNHVHIASNLLRQVPNARVVMDTYTAGSDLGIVGPADRNCYFVWFRKYRDHDPVPFEAALEQALRRLPLDSERAAVESVESVTAKWQTNLLWDWGPDTIIGIATLDSATPICAGGRIPGLSPPPSGNSKQ